MVTRLRAPKQQNTTQQEELKSISQETDAKIATTLIKCKNDALTDITLNHIETALRQLAQYANLQDPEDVKHYISVATTKTKKQLASDTKNRLLYAYSKFCKYQEIKWQRPYYKNEHKIPLIPTTKNVNAIIDNASHKYVTIFTMLTEIGCAPHELSNVTTKDINAETGEISIQGVKGHASGTYKLKPQTAEMLRQYLAHYPPIDKHPFPSERAICQVWIDTKKRASKRLMNPDLLKIECRNLRNYSGAQYYIHLPVRDPWKVMRHLRHKKLQTTLHYLEGMDLDEDPTYEHRIALDVKQACAYIDEGYEYVTGNYNDGGKIFRKRK